MVSYKSIVSNLLMEDSKAWVSQLLKGIDIDYNWLDAKIMQLEKEHDIDSILYSCEIRIWKGYPRTLLVGGTVDDIVGICHSVIWNEKHDIIWMSREEARKSLGIDKFEI